MKKFVAVAAVVAAAFLAAGSGSAARAFAMPFYGLEPQPIVLRAEFSTSYASSSAERKHKIELAAKALHHALIPPE